MNKLLLAASAFAVATAIAAPALAQQTRQTSVVQDLAAPPEAPQARSYDHSTGGGTLTATPANPAGVTKVGQGTLVLTSASSGAASGNTIQGNRIGTDAAAAAPPAGSDGYIKPATLSVRKAGAANSD